MTAQHKKLEVDVANLHVPHPSVRAEDWRSPLARRLVGSDDYDEQPRVMADSFRGPDAQPTTGELSLSWSGLRTDFGRCINTYQGPVLTEFAALALACVLVWGRAELRVVEVTRRGERADYWLGHREGEKELLLEVAGRQGGKIEELCDEKAKQLLENPFGRSGYVCVAEFDDRVARLWFYAGGDA